MPIAFSPELAAREVLTWFDPSRAPRIEWSKVMRRSDLLSADAGTATIEAVPLAGGKPFGLGFFGSDTLPPVMVVVVASTFGMDALAPHHSEPGGCVPAGGDERESVFALFEPESGRLLSAGLMEPQWNRVVDRWRALAPLSYQAHASATPTSSPTPAETNPSSPMPTPSPTDPPAGLELTRRNLHPALERVFAAYPLWPGASWTWRSTGRGAGVRWCATTITESVEAAWLVAPDRALVKVRLHETPITDAGTCYRWWTGRRSGAIYREVVANGVSIPDWPRYPTPPPLAGRIALEPLTDHFDPASRSFLSDDYAAEDVSVTTPAGSFDGCTTFYVVGGSYWGNQRWFCPGVGYVRDEFRSCSAWMTDFMVNELVRWTVPDW